jgi:hypothetical protein
MFRTVRFILPVKEGEWFAKWEKKEGFDYSPVIAWVFGDWVKPGPDYDIRPATQLWDGLVAFTDGPDVVGDFINFVCFAHRSHLTAEELRATMT